VVIPTSTQLAKGDTRRHRDYLLRLTDSPRNFTIDGECRLVFTLGSFALRGPGPCGISRHCGGDDSLQYLVPLGIPPRPSLDVSHITSIALVADPRDRGVAWE
jgi:hypothetical protein